MNMNLTEACQLAMAIDASGKATVVAIGRFLPVEQLTRSDRWGCSVRLPSGQVQTVWSGMQWSALIALENKPQSQPAGPLSAPKVIPPTLNSSRPDAAHRRQPTLF